MKLASISSSAIVLQDGLNIDLDEEGRLIGLDASQRYSKSFSQKKEIRYEN